MQAFILAAGLGTRLRPWTLHHPKALVPVGGVPMLERVILNLKEAGVAKIVVNTHHLADQITEYLKANDFGIPVTVSDESQLLLDTGGGLAKAASLFNPGEAVLVHNVDILSDAPLRRLYATHMASGRDVTLLTSNRETSRKLAFDPDGKLWGWINHQTGTIRPEGFQLTDSLNLRAFSGIYIVGPRALESIKIYALRSDNGKFPIMDWLLENPDHMEIGEYYQKDLLLIDIGKPDTLGRAQELFAGGQ